MTRRFSFTRLFAILAKEFIQMRRDRMTFAMMIGVPLMQLMLFGFAINSDPKHLATAVLAADHSVRDRKRFAELCRQAGEAAASGAIVDVVLMLEFPLSRAARRLALRS